MDFNSAYSSLRTGNSAATNAQRTDFQRDFDRIIFSSAFRRLQNKTQVFPLPGSVFVHNRLTHSLEVSSVGRSLGSIAGGFIAERFKKELSQESENFYKNHLSAVVSSACLCHDVGNPAFGHSGEDAIATYFVRNSSGLKEKFTEKEWADFINFEGNANAMRVLTHRQTGKDEGGAQLTFATLASIAKYPCEAVAKNKASINTKKFGFFQNDKEIFNEIAKCSGMMRESEEPLIFKRNPFVWLVEAADDICYNIIDMEDAHRLGIISTPDCENLFYNVISEAKTQDMKKVSDKLANLTNANEKISYLRAKVINALINKSIELYQHYFDQIIDGSLNQSLLDIFRKESRAMQDVEKFSIEKIYGHRSVLEIENAGYNVMYELLNHFVPPVIKPKADRKLYEKRALQLLPAQFLYEDGTDYQKVLGIVDFIAGMTDNFATDLYRKIKGIEIGMTV